jgi:thioredoxin 1
MATVEVTEKTFEATGIQAIPSLMVLRDGVLLATLPGVRPAAALDDLIGKVRAIDMDEVRRELDAEEKAQPRAAQAGGA